VFLAVRRFNCGDIGGERGNRGRLFEVTEIATKDDKMLTKEVLSNTSWTSAELEWVGMLMIRPAMCRLAVTGAYRHHLLDQLAFLVVPLEKADFGDASDGDRHF
jgi:hypothetical protein